MSQKCLQNDELLNAHPNDHSKRIKIFQIHAISKNVLPMHLYQKEEDMASTERELQQRTVVKGDSLQQDWARGMGVA